MNIVEENRKRELYFIEDKNIVFIPRGWGDYFTVANGFLSGPDDHEDGPSILGYCPCSTIPNTDDIVTLWYDLEQLKDLREVSREEAQVVHPALFEHLAKINNEAISR